MILNALVERLKRRSKDDFRGRHYEASLILQAVSWYLRYPLSYRDIEEMLLERGLEVDHSTLNRWVLAYAPLIERRLRHFRKPHCGSVRIDETYIRIRGQWRYLYRAIDKHGTPVDFLLTARRDLDAAKRFFRKMLEEQPLLAPDRIGTDAAGPDQAPAAGDRERSLPGEEEHASDRGLPVLHHRAAHDPGVRGHAVAAQGVRLCGHLDSSRAEPVAHGLFRTSRS
jgi:transposase-like protein